jgi:hypothetical protein
MERVRWESGIDFSNSRVQNYQTTCEPIFGTVKLPSRFQRYAFFIELTEGCASERKRPTLALACNELVAANLA